MSNILYATLSIVLLVLLQGCETVPVNERLIIREKGDAITLDVPVSSVALSFKKGELEDNRQNIGGGTANPRYFCYKNARTGFIVSGWFEHSNKYKGITEHARSLLNKKQIDLIGEKKNIKITRYKKWDFLIYDLEAKYKGNEKVFTNFWAQYVSRSTWIELHFSVPKTPKAQMNIETFIDGLEIINK